VISLADLARAVVDARGDALVVTGPGAVSGALWSCGHHPATIYNMELAYASSVAYGAALARPDRRAISLEGDGSLLAALPILATVARQRAPNLTIVAVVNGVYGTGDNKTETVFAGVADLVAVAIGLGWDKQHVVSADTVGDLRSALERTLASAGPWLVVANVDPASYELGGVRARPGVDVYETAIDVRRYYAADGADRADRADRK
jgi:thiamine pyrophosphate-dependent acetolactate synthase large subunit-like protein